jgi:hypothetical protein
MMYHFMIQTSTGLIERRLARKLSTIPKRIATRHPPGNDGDRRRTGSGIPNARLRVYEGAPHGLFLTHKDRLNADLLGFVKT